MNSVMEKSAGSHDAQDVMRAATLAPRVDILENENELMVYSDLPGVKNDNLDIRFEKGELTLHGRRPAVDSAEMILREVEAGDFFRSFRISEKIDGEKIWAELKDGVLTLHLPKSEKAKPRKIAVKSA